MTYLPSVSLLTYSPRPNYLFNLRNVNNNAYSFKAYLPIDQRAMCQHFISPKLNDRN
jgi:hypothetical protein